MAGITGNGTALTFAGTTVGRLTSVNNSSSCASIEVTTMDDTAATYLAGIPDSGEVSFEGNYLAATYASLETARAAKTTGAVTITFSDSSDFSASGFITSLGTGAGLNGGVTITGTIKLSGAQTHSAT